MKTGSIAEAVNATQLTGNGHAACAHLKTGWITNSCNEGKQTHNTPVNKSRLFTYLSQSSKGTML